MSPTANTPKEDLSKMYVHVKKSGELPADLGEVDPLAEVAAGRVRLIHSECVGGELAVETDGDVLALVCGKCEARQELDRDEAVDALSRVLVHDEYAWGGDAGFLPD